MMPLNWLLPPDRIYTIRNKPPSESGVVSDLHPQSYRLSGTPTLRCDNIGGNLLAGSGHSEQ